MTGRKKHGKSAQALQSMLPSTNAASLARTGRSTTRAALVITDERVASTATLSASQSPAPVGSQHTNSTLVWSASLLSPSMQNWIQQYDSYRMLTAEVYATLTWAFRSGGSDLGNLPVVLYSFVDMDTDPGVTTSWIRVRDRPNLSRVVLRANAPSQLIAKVTLRPSYNATGAQNPGNLIGKTGAWLDSLNLSQVHTGLRSFSYCPQVDNSGQPEYSYVISYTTRLTVGVRAAI